MDHIYGAKTISGKFVHEDSSKILLCSTGKKQHCYNIRPVSKLLQNINFGVIVASL